MKKLIRWRDEHCLVMIVFTLLAAVIAAAIVGALSN